MSMPTSRKYLTKYTNENVRKTNTTTPHKKDKSSQKEASIQQPVSKECSEATSQEVQQLDPILQLTLLLTLIGSSSTKTE